MKSENIHAGGAKNCSELQIFTVHTFCVLRVTELTLLYEGVAFQNLSIVLSLEEEKRKITLTRFSTILEAK